MIKCDKGFIQVSGEKSMILAEVSVIIHSLQNAFMQEEGGSEDKAKEDIMEAVNLAFSRKKQADEMDEEMTEEKVEKAAEKLGELIHRVVDEVLKGKGDK